jgi:hypothetical protein
MIHALQSRTMEVKSRLEHINASAPCPRPGQLSPHIVQLRQQQAAARQASNQSKQSLIRAATAFVRETGIEMPPRVALEVFITSWTEANVPKDVVAAT